MTEKKKNEKGAEKKETRVAPRRIPGQQIRTRAFYSAFLFFMPKTAYELLVILSLTLSFIRLCPRPEQMPLSVARLAHRDFQRRSYFNKEIDGSTRARIRAKTFAEQDDNEVHPFFLSYRNIAIFLCIILITRFQ